MGNVQQCECESVRALDLGVPDDFGQARRRLSFGGKGFMVFSLSFPSNFLHVCIVGLAAP